MDSVESRTQDDWQLEILTIFPQIPSLALPELEITHIENSQ